MNDLKFWNNWQSSHRMIYYLLLSIFGITVIYYCYALYKGEDIALDWLITSSLDTIDLPVKSIKVGLFEMELRAENYLINQHFAGSVHQLQPHYAYVFLGIISLCLAILLSLITFLKRFWYLVFMTVATFIFVNFRFEQLEINGWIDNTFLIVVLALILPVSYYFHSLRRYHGFIVRFLCFTVVFAIIAIIIALFSNKENPFHFLIHYSYATPVVISILFILIVSHEIIFLILYLTSGSSAQGSRNNLFHFITLSLIYLANVGLVYFRNAGHIDWNILYFNAFLLLLISSIIGFWGFRQREVKYENIFSFDPYGGIFYVTLGIICFSTISYQMATANDPVLEAFEDVIIYSHIGFGLMFMLYILANFINLLMEKLPVYRVAYKENTMPYFSANIAGLVVAGAFYYLSNQAALQQAIAGYYNGLGSVYYHDGNRFLSQEYYRTGSIFGFNNHRSNYSMAELASFEGESNQAIRRFKNATLKNPTEHAFVNLANIQKAENKIFEALFTLKDGLKVFPGSDEIKNNLGLIFKDANILDSAVYYMERGAQSSWGNKTNTTNIIDILARYDVRLPPDSLTAIFRKSTHLPLKANMLAYNNKTGYWLNESLDKSLLDSALDLHQFGYLHNHYFSLLPVSSASIIRDLQNYADHSANGAYREQILFLKALHHYMRNDVSGCFRSIDILQTHSGRKAYYNQILGVIAMEQGSPGVAMDYFQKAADGGYPGAEANLAISLMEAGQLDKSADLWNRIAKRDSAEVIKEVLSVLTSTSAIVQESGSDALKYQFIRYRAAELQKDDLDRLIKSISDKAFRSGALIHLGNELIKAESYTEVQEIIVKLSSDPSFVEYGSLVEQIQENVNLAMLSQELVSLEVLDENNPIRRHWENWQQDQSAEALLFYRRLGLNNPFDEVKTILAARFFNKVVNDIDQAYAILLNAIEINPYSPRLLKEYILQAIKIGQPNFAQNELPGLKDLIPPEEYKAFQSKMDEEISAYEDFVFPIER